MRGFRLGSIAGFEIRIDYSWFLIFFLILWTFSAGVFPAQFPGLTSGSYIGMGLVGALLFFASLLAHELSHSIVARRRGVVVEGITLFIFGGVSRMRQEAETPYDEFIIAGAGPLASVAIAVLFGVAGGIGAWLGLGPAFAGVVGYLAFLNIALAIFNLLPGFPLDGGRLFRAFVWRRTGDLLKATRWATTGGRWLGYTLMALGVIEIFMGALVGGMWLAFIGWFVRTAAEASFRQHLFRESFTRVSAKNLMTRDPESVPRDWTVQAFVDRYIMEGRHRAWPVSDDGRAAGLITVDRLRSVPRDEWPRHTVEDFMVPADNDLTVPEDESMTRVIDKLSHGETGRILVTSDGRLVGIITGTDLARWFDRAKLLGDRH